MLSSGDKKKEPKSKTTKKASGGKKTKKVEPGVKAPQIPKEMINLTAKTKEMLHDVCEHLSNANFEFSEFRVDMPNTPSAVPIGLVQAAVATACDLAGKAWKALDEVQIALQQAISHLESYETVCAAEQGQRGKKKK